MLRKAYQNVAKNGDKLAEAEKRLDWEAFAPIIAPMYHNKTQRGGRPNVDPVRGVKMPVLRQRIAVQPRHPVREADPLKQGLKPVI